MNRIEAPRHLAEFARIAGILDDDQLKADYLAYERSGMYEEADVLINEIRARGLRA